MKTQKQTENEESMKAIDAIKKKLLGKKLSYKEIFSLMDEVAHEKLGPVLTTYFVAAGFKEGFSNQELFYLTKAMADTGTKLKFKGIVADKHSTGGLAGTRTTMILVPIIAAAGYKIPKNSSRAITTPAGTADTMEVLAPVTFHPEKIQKIVEKVGGCIVWGGHLGLAPADDVIIRVETPLAFESFDKIIVSIMAKKIASGATHLVLDIPVGPTLKVKHFKDAEIIATKFHFLAKKFNIKLTADVNEALEPAGHAVGPVLEAHDVLKVLEQKPDRPFILEAKALRLAGKLLDLCMSDSREKKEKQTSGEDLARQILKSGGALKKMREIIKAQGGDPDIDIPNLKLGSYKYEFPSPKHGTVTSFNNEDLTVIAKILGCPYDKKAGIYIERRIDEKVDNNDILCVLYSSDKWRLSEAKETLKQVPIYKIE
ncbi:thymidine phosphorylase [Patescibacteria group bacterium]|nr:thymidine phosphorylase [Patescibacteria group bacterium]MCL5797928.1 thymidine phosphorylase [Patescibacteria group bacterium]